MSLLETPRSTEPNPGWFWAGGKSPASGRIWDGCFEVIVERLVSGVDLTNPKQLEDTVLIMETSELIPHAEEVASYFQALGERGFLDRFEGHLVGRPVARSHEEM